MIPAVTCPFCRGVLRLSDRLRVGQTVFCHGCDAPFTVLRLNPVELGWSEADEWDADGVNWKRNTAKAPVKEHDASRYRHADWEAGDADWKMMAGKSRKRKRNQRSTRRRRRDRDELYQDPW